MAPFTALVITTTWLQLHCSWESAQNDSRHPSGVPSAPSTSSNTTTAKDETSTLDNNSKNVEGDHFLCAWIEKLIISIDWHTCRILQSHIFYRSKNVHMLQFTGTLRDQEFLWKDTWMTPEKWKKPHAGEETPLNIRPKLLYYVQIQTSCEV